MPAPSSPSTEARIRWWPALLLLALLAARLGQVWFFRDYDQQFKVEGSRAPLKYALLGLGVWWLLFSRIRWRARLLGVVALGTGAAIFLALFRVHGVTGDRLPVFEWRWKARPGEGFARGAIPAVPKAAPPESPPAAAAVAGFPQFLGPDRNGILAGPRPKSDLRTDPPKELWRRPVGGGWSGFAISGGRAVTLEQNGEREEITCYRLATGEPMWVHGYPARYDNSQAGAGPRSVPAVADGRVYTTGGTGVLTCVELETGREIWRVDLVAAHRSQVPQWGYSVSPLVRSNVVIVVPGGRPGQGVAGYDAGSGKVVWVGGDSWAGYASPVTATLGGVEQLLVFHIAALAGHDPATGRLLWEHPFLNMPHVANPVPVSSNRVAISYGYGGGTFLLEVGADDAGAWSARQVWKSIRLKSKFANFVARDGHLYGLDDGMLACLSLESGEQKWKETRYGHGQLLLVGGLLLVFTEAGELALVEVSPEKPVELSRTRLFEGKTWNPPALAGDMLLVRTDREAACFRLALETKP